MKNIITFSLFLCINFSQIVMLSGNILLIQADSIEVDAGKTKVLTCKDTSIILGSLIEINPNYSYEWKDVGDNILSNTTTCTINQPGLYYLFVMDTGTGETGVDSVEVTQDIGLPELPSIITCKQKEKYEEISFDLFGLANINIIDISPKTNVVTTDSSYLIYQAGTYELVCQSIYNFCTTTTEFIVENEPQIEIKVEGILGCSESFVQLTAFPDNDDSYSYEWSTNGVIIGVSNPISVTTSGLVHLSATNNITGCTSEFTIEVEQNTEDIYTTLSSNQFCKKNNEIQIEVNTPVFDDFEIRWFNEKGVVISSSPSIPIVDIGSIQNLYLHVSTEDCPSLFQEKITLYPYPVLENDYVTLEAFPNKTFINYYNNDNPYDYYQWRPKEDTVYVDQGKLKFSPDFTVAIFETEAPILSDFSIDYEICNTTCEECISSTIFFEKTVGIRELLLDTKNQIQDLKVFDVSGRIYPKITPNILIKLLNGRNGKLHSGIYFYSFILNEKYLMTGKILL